MQPSRPPLGLYLGSKIPGMGGKTHRMYYCTSRGAVTRHPKSTRTNTTNGVLGKYAWVRGTRHRVGLGVGARLTAVHCRSRHDCFMRPGPPNFFMSRQKWQSPHSVRTQARQRRQRVRRRRAPAPGPRLLDDIGGVSNAEGCEQMRVRSDRPA